MNRKFHQALAGKNSGPPPVWLMRQAGRILPSYRALREVHSLSDLFFTPELAARVTLLPVDELGVDAAIIFSDITVIAKALGLSLDFVDGVGPIISPLLVSREQIDGLCERDVREVLAPIAEAIRLAKQRLDVPLIGFCGGPFTVARYLVEGLQSDPIAFHALLERLCRLTCDYIDLQIDAGVEAMQIFDSWAHVLDGPERRIFCLPYHDRLIRHVQRRGIPAISFMRGSAENIGEVAALLPNAISCDWHRPMAVLRAEVGPDIVLQGNLDPSLLLAPLSEVTASTEVLIGSMRGDRAFIANLGHGVKPQTPLAAVRRFIEVVKHG